MKLFPFWGGHPMPRISRIRRSGFTLIEILIAITIFMLVLVSIYSAWMSLLRGTKAGLDAAAQMQRTRISLRAVEDALSTAEMFDGNMKQYYFVADTTDEDFAALTFVSRLPASFPGSGLFGDQVVRRGTFAIQPGTNNTRELVMSQLPLLLETNDTIQPYPITLARDVSMFHLRFWDTNLNDWVDEFPTTNQIPKMVEVTLGFGKQGAYSHEPLEVYQRIVALPANVVTRDVQNPSAGRVHFPRIVKTLPDGTRVMDDGSQILKDNTRVYPDGSRVLPDGTRVLKDGTRVPPPRTGNTPLPGAAPPPIIQAPPPVRVVPRGR